MIRDCFDCTLFPDLEPKNGEDLWVESTIGTTRPTIGVIYRPPGQTVSALEQCANDLEHTLNLISAKRDNTILLLGDFNAKCTAGSQEHQRMQLALFFLASNQALPALDILPTRHMHVAIDDDCAGPFPSSRRQ